MANRNPSSGPPALPTGMSFVPLPPQATTIVVVDGLPFVQVDIVGQSFILNQIRRMLGPGTFFMTAFLQQKILFAL